MIKLNKIDLNYLNMFFFFFFFFFFAVVVFFWGGDETSDRYLFNVILYTVDHRTVFEIGSRYYCTLKNGYLLYTKLKNNKKSILCITNTFRETHE